MSNKTKKGNKRSTKKKTSTTKKSVNNKNQSKKNSKSVTSKSTTKKVTNKNITEKKNDSKNNKQVTEKINNIKEKIEVNETSEPIKKKSFIKDTFGYNLLFITSMFFLVEILFRLISSFKIFDYATLRILISSFILAFIVTFLSNLTKRKWLKNTINIISIFIYSVYAWIQLGFINYLGVYISFNTSSQFGAVKDYIFDYLMSFKPVYYIMFIPFILGLIYYLFILKKTEYKKHNFNKKYLLLIPTMIVMCLLYYGTLNFKFMQNELQIKSNLKLFKNPDVPTVAVNQFGTMIFGGLDLKVFLFPVDEEIHTFNPPVQDEPIDVSREVSPFLMELANTDTNSKYSSLNNYFASQKVVDYNDHTGMFEGKNVVVILMESVNEAIINEEYFPNFTKLYNEGWSWVNNYSPRNSCATGNNEFSAMTGLYSIYNTCTSNVYKNNTYFESIFGLFNDKGYTTTSMHNFVEWYYYRSTIHPNMGSGKYYGARDLGIKTSYYGEWPSDVEFFEKAFDIILNDESDAPWMTWLTTVTSHQPYTSSSKYGDLYKNDFKKLGYSNAVSRYLSKLKVVDEAIGVMINKLTEAGVLEDTVIVMLADHYPYGLNNSYISEMIDHDLGDYEREKTPFVIYNPEMTPETFTEYNSYINLVPTIANLMNLDYDPRLYMGTDLFSEDFDSKVVFADGSWKNEYAYYNASTSKMKYYGDVTYTPEEIQAINTEVDLKISMSSKAIKSNYFKYLEEKLTEYNNKEIEVDTEIIIEPGSVN